jgi:hypothetical protein
MRRVALYTRADADRTSTHTARRTSHAENSYAHRPDINLRCVPEPEIGHNDLGREKVGRADHRLHTRSPTRRDAEISQLDKAFSCDENVARFDVAMCEHLAVH